MSAREELAAVLAGGCRCHEIDCCAYADSLPLADALLASPALVRVIREATAEAWDEGATEASPYSGAYLRSLLIFNPYRDQTEENN